MASSLNPKPEAFDRLLGREARIRHSDTELLAEAETLHARGFGTLSSSLVARCPRVGLVHPCDGEVILSNDNSTPFCPLCSTRCVAVKRFHIFSRNWRAVRSWLRGRLEATGRSVVEPRAGVFEVDGKLLYLVDLDNPLTDTIPETPRPSAFIIAGEGCAYFGARWQLPWVSLVEGILYPERGFNGLLATVLEVPFEVPTERILAVPRTAGRITIYPAGDRGIVICTPWFGRQHFTASDLGMVNSRTREPNEAFRLLIRICHREGRCTWETAGCTSFDSFRVQVQAIRDALSAAAHTTDPLFEELARNGSLVCRFRACALRP